MMAMFENPAIEQASRHIVARVVLAAVRRSLAEPDQRAIIDARVERDRQDKSGRKEECICSM